MATALPELDDILATLSAGPLQRAVADFRLLVDDLPQPDPESPDAVSLDVAHQVDQAYRTLLHPLKFELEAAEKLAVLAEDLGVDGVQVQLPGPDDAIAVLTDPERRLALKAMIDLLGPELAAVRSRAEARARGQ